MGQDLTSAQVGQIWQRIARWWDQQIDEGNEFQKQLIMPATDRLLAPSPGQTILDVACGNGNYSRRLGRAGANVVACDYCQEFLDCARRRTSAADGKIEYVRIDATDLSQLLSLGAGRFDSAVCSMAMMDMPVIEPLLAGMAKLLKPGGRFVFSLPHPCFNSIGTRMTAELVNEGGKVEQIFGVSVSKYLEVRADLSSGILNQPEPHWGFERPLSVVMAACFVAGFVVDGFEEPAFAPGGSGKNAFSWAKRPNLPPAVVVRIRGGHVPDDVSHVGQ